MWDQGPSKVYGIKLYRYIDIHICIKRTKTLKTISQANTKLQFRFHNCLRNRGMSHPDFVDDPAGEVDHWFKIVANAPNQVLQDIEFWQRLPLYSQYIINKSLSEVVEDCMSHIKSCRGLSITVEEASRLEHHMGRVTLLPLAVMATFLHHGCGLPDIFAFDLFQACLASCQRTEVAVACYADRSKKFCCRARWWACPPGDLNAGKSPPAQL